MARKPTIKKAYTATVKMSPDWAGWLRTGRHQFVKMIQREQIEGQGPDVVLYFPPRFNGLQRGFGVNLSDMTEEELVTFKGWLDELIDLALPISAIRDKKAREAYEQGDDSFQRLYRGAPEVFTRPWAVGLDGKSIFERLAYDAIDDGDSVSGSDGLSDSVSDLAEQDEARGKTIYDKQETVGTEELGQVGGLPAGDIGRVQTTDAW